MKRDCIAGVALAIGLSCAATASSAGAVKGFHAPVRPSANITKLKSTLSNWGFPGSALSPGFNTIDTETVSCPKAQGCTLVIHVMDNIGLAQASGAWAIVVVVDGNYVDDGPFQGIEPQDSYDATGNWQNFYPVAQGSHTVTVQTYVEAAATQAEWSDTISLGVGQ